MSFQIDFRTMPANVPVLCIPRVYSNISETRIRGIFDDLNLGQLDRIDIVNKNSDKGEKFNRVFIHFRRWNDTENANIARERLLNGKEIKIIYDDPWFWKISAYREVERRPPAPKNVAQKRKPILQFDDSDEDRTFNATNTSNTSYNRRQDNRRRPEDNRRRPEDNRRRPEDNRRRPEDNRRRPEDNRHQDNRRQDNRHQDNRRRPEEVKQNPEPETPPMEKDKNKIDYGNMPIPIIARKKKLAIPVAEVVKKPLKIEEKEDKEDGEDKEEKEEKEEKEDKEDGEIVANA